MHFKEDFSMKETENRNGTPTVNEYYELGWHVIEVTDSLGNSTVIKAKSNDTLITRNGKQLLDTIALAHKKHIFEQKVENFNKSKAKLDSILSRFKI